MMVLVGIGMLLLGALATFLGLLWFAQGSGYFPFPHDSNMIGEAAWMWRGGVAMVVGVVLMATSRRVG